LQSLKVLFREKRYYKPFLTLNALFLFMIFSGKFAIEFYAVREVAYLAIYNEQFVGSTQSRMGIYR
jgi:hypothetical protein